MSLRSIAVAFLGIGLALSLGMSLYGQERCTGYAQQMAKLSARIEVMAKLRPIASDSRSKGPADGPVLIASDDGPARIEYRQSGRVLAIDYLGEGSMVVRRDLLEDGRVRAQEYFEDRRLVSRQFLDVAGKPVCTETPAGIIPLIPTLRPGIY